MPSVARLSRDRLVLIFVKRASANGGQAMLKFSDDNARSWSDPKPLTPHGTAWRFLNDRLLRLQSGRLFLPVLHEQLGCLAWISDNDGQSWRMSTGTIRPNEGESCCEPSMVELPGGRVAIFLRTANKTNQIYIASSHDGDSGWRIDNEWGPLSLLAPCLAKRLPDSEEVLLLWNNHCIGANLTSAVSSPPLRFWDHLQVIEQQDRWPQPKIYHSPSIAFRNGQSHLTCVESEPVSGSQPVQRLVYRRIPISKFRADARRRPVPYDSCAYVRSSWEQAPADDTNKYLREFATASFNPVDARRADSEAQGGVQ